VFSGTGASRSAAFALALAPPLDHQLFHPGLGLLPLVASFLCLLREL
jgi:hypothetical protein